DACGADRGRLRKKLVSNRKTHISVLMIPSSEPGEVARQSCRDRQRFIASARNCWNFSAFSASVRAENLDGAAFSASGIGFRGRAVAIVVPSTDAPAGFFLEVLAMSNIMPAVWPAGYALRPGNGLNLGFFGLFGLISHFGTAAATIRLRVDFENDSVSLLSD
ncbi:MAG TPA: hypothetical protein VM510_04575, partial [Caulifigura sp.]|nr:hypothetical protein [Caulifigura sp.]